MTKQVCQISGEEFEVSDLEIKLREKFGFSDLPKTAPWVRFRELGAFWPHWNLHNRKCDKTGKNIISIFSEKCPYPVWKRVEWIKENNPSSVEYDFSRDFFSQAWELFQQCPIPHKTGTSNTNCEYSSNSFYSKNCYLCEFPYKSEDLLQCYRAVNTKDSSFTAFCFDSELTVDAINSRNCFDSKFVLDCRQVSSSAFLYDCRNCSDCMFCFNLRNKQYYFGNKKHTKEEYFKKKEQWNLKSREIYDKAKHFFEKMMIRSAWHRGLQIDKSENTSGNYVENSRDLQNCFFSKEIESCCNVLRNLLLKDSLDCTSAGMNSELIFSSSNIVDTCYQLRFCFDTPQSKFLDYCAYCFQCENCFGCCGLVGKKYCIFNKQYTKEEYEKTREKIIEQMKITPFNSPLSGGKETEWGKVFPGHFAPNPYDESWASFYWPLSREKQQELGFRLSEISERKNKNYSEVSEIPDSTESLDSGQARMTTEELSKKIFWDEKYKKPFQITMADIKFSQKIGCPLPNSYYMRRIQENFSWMPFNGKLRDCECGKCAKKIQTSWPDKYDERILCEECYLQVLN